MILYLIKNLVKINQIIYTLTTHKPNKISKIEDKGIYVETISSKEKFEKGEKTKPTDFFPWNFIEQGWVEFIKSRIASADDFDKAEGRSSFLMALFNELPIVEQTVKNNKTAIKLKEYTTSQLPETNLDHCLILLNEIKEDTDSANINNIYKDKNIIRLKSGARQGLKLLGFLNSTFQVNKSLINKYNNSQNERALLKDQIKKQYYFKMIIQVLDLIPALSKNEKTQYITEIGMLTVRNSRGENLMLKTVAEKRTRNILQWLEQVGLVDEEWNVIVDGELRSSLLKVMNEYLNAKNGPFAGHELGGTIRNVIPSLLGNLYFIDKNQYTIKGSVGQGNWASVPWVAVMNNKVTTSTQRGYYIVYLFSEDMKSLYLTIAQGVTETSRDEMEKVSQSLRHSISMNNRVIKGNDLNLGQSSKAKEYELSTAAYIPYSIDHMPSEQQLIRDLEEMVGYYEEFIIIKDNPANELVKEPPTPYYSMSEIIDQINTYIASKGFYYKKEEIINLFLSLKTKPFVIISGISGTGKTKVVQWFAESIGATEDNGQFTLIPVRPDWNDGSDLLGFVDIKGDFKEGPLTKVLNRAEENPTLPYFVLLDEMNLARVEYYFSDMLSVMESRRWQDGKIVTSKLLSDEIVNKSITLPSNVYIIGTVNMDETTHPFSKKVLDRANTIEFNEVNLGYLSFLHDLEVSERIELRNDQLTGNYLHLKDVYKVHSSIVEAATNELVRINDILKPIGAHIGYRVRDEICFYLSYNEEGHLFSYEQAFDRCVLQKILPRLSGSDYRVQSVLDGLYTFCTNRVYIEDGVDDLSLAKYPRCAMKIVEMRRRLVDDGFTSFWIGS
ncbi:MrcB family domain-containing protein [Metabacillus halosaccharovorans]|uniref:DUF3578 domain-containing protein n=1 Tax=Metabacillus halosaccharovorans TaxID=930124 RepID=A0ABT3DDS2_9BACI|nr:DUF3578 domain-containing protein [Metabacillus halosaccharovorans]MCV9885114.1 DUF3578 domain-containing protein [Metabacillus halosaccharovorans]